MEKGEIMPPWERYQKPDYSDPSARQAAMMELYPEAVPQGPWSKYQGMEKAVAPQISAFDGALKDIGRNTAESFMDSVNATGAAVSEPWIGENTPPYLMGADLFMRTAGKAGNALGGLYGVLASPFHGALTSTVENTGVIPATARAIKDNLVPNDPRFTADISPEQQHRLAKGIGGDLTAATFMGAGGIQGKNFRNSMAGIETPKPYNPITETIAPLVNKAEAVSQKLPGLAGNTSGAPLSKPMRFSADDVKTASQNAYEYVAQVGGEFNPQFANKVHSVIQKAKIKPFAKDILTKEDAAINASLSDFDGLTGKRLTLEDYQRLDSALGDKASQAYVSGRVNEGRIISGAQDKIREMVSPSALKESDISGGRAGLDALTNDAIPLWSTQAKMADIQKIIDRANMMDNPTTAMRTGFRNLAFNKKRMGTYPKEVQKLIIKAADTGKIDDLLGIVGSRLNPIIGTSVGGVQGAAISQATSMAARGLRNKIRNNQADKVVNSLVERVRPNIERNLAPRAVEKSEPLRLTYQPEPKTVVVDSKGRAIPMSARDREILGQSPAVKEPTMQEIMKMKPSEARAALEAYRRRRKDYRK